VCGLDLMIWTATFDEWFDGGARRFVTGYTEYYFSSGCKATHFVMPLIAIYIEFPDGRRVSVHEERKQ
jgi:hypothetical protein